MAFKNDSEDLANLVENSEEDGQSTGQQQPATTPPSASKHEADNNAEANSEDEEDEEDEEEEDEAEGNKGREVTGNGEVQGAAGQVQGQRDLEVTSCGPDDIGNPEKDPKQIRKRQ